MDWPCPVCGAATRFTFFARSGHPIHSCPTCTHRFVAWRPPPEHVAQTYGDDYFFGGGAGYPDYLRNAKLLRAHGRRYARILHRHVTMGSILDVGAAGGFICDAFRSEGWHPEGLEPNEHMAQFGRDDLNLVVHTGDLEHAQIDRQFDLVSMIQVIAHFISPRHALASASQLTRDGGFWLIETWDYRSFTARLFGRHWHEYDPPSVLQFFSPRSLERLAAHFGFRRIAAGRPRKYIEWRHARSLLAHSEPWLRSITGILPDDLVLPYPAEDLFWMLFQKDGEPSIRKSRAAVSPRIAR